MIKQNLHTHSCYDDGKDTIEQMVQAAVDQHFTILGFSGHAYNPVDDGSMSVENTMKYLNDVRDAKAHAPQGLNIYLGIEEDSLNPIDHPENYDYVIGSIHYLQPDDKACPIDYSKDRFDLLLKEGYGNDIHALAKDYFSAMEKQAENDRMQIVGHIDLIAKYNEDESYYRFADPVINGYAKKAIEKLANAGKIFEMNTGAISRGYRKTPYPSFEILKMIKEVNGRILINTDCHNRENLDLGIQTCIDLAKQAGFKTLEMFNGKTFEAKPIEEFMP